MLVQHGCSSFTFYVIFDTLNATMDDARDTSKRAAAVAAARRARWVTAEATRLKCNGLTFRQIAEQLTLVGRGQAQSLTPIPEGVRFPSAYKISAAACHKTYVKAMSSEPALEVGGLRKLHLERCEQMFQGLQPRSSNGDTRAVIAAVKLLDHVAKLFGLYKVQQVGPKSTREMIEMIPIELLREMAGNVEEVKATDQAEKLQTKSNSTLPPPSAGLDADEPEKIDLPKDFTITIDELRRAAGDEPEDEGKS